MGITVGIVIIVVILFITYWKFDKICICLKKTENFRESNEIESFRSRFKNTFDSAPPPLEIVQDFKTNEGNLRNRKKSVVFEKKSKNNVPKIQSKSKSDDVQYDFQFHYINEDVLEVVRQIYSLSLHILDC